MKTYNENALGVPLLCNTSALPDHSHSEHQYSSLLAEKQVCRSCSSTKQIEEEVVELFYQHTPALSRYAAILSRDTGIAQDAVQEAFLRYFIVRTKGEQVQNPRAWLFRVLKNYIFDCSRKSVSARTANLNEAAEIPDFQQDVEAGYQRTEMFRNAILQLPPREQQCVLLRLEGFSYNEISEILRICSGTVGALLARALKKIRKAGLLSRGH